MYLLISPVAVLFALPAAAQPLLLLPDNREGWPWGMVAHHLIVQHQNESTRALDELGAPWVRTDFLWYEIEPARGQFNWSVMDQIVDVARASGYLIYGNLSYTPQWATDGLQTTGVPRSADYFRDFARAAAERYRDRVKHWGIWNEPESPDRFWAGTPQEFVNLVLRPGYEALKAADPAAVVLAPDSGDDDWLDAFFKAGGGNYLDVITVHVYACCDNTDDVKKVLLRLDCTGGWPWDKCRKRVIDNNGLGAKPVWLTEVGWKTLSPEWEQKQAAYYTQLLDEMRKRPWWKKTIFYELYDATPCDPGKDNCWGVLRTDWSRKPAFDALKAYIAAHQPRAEAGPDLRSSSGATVTLDGAASRDPDGRIVKYRWDFDRSDGVVEQAAGVSVNRVYGAPGVYVATLVVTDNDGIEDADTVTVTVTDVPDAGHDAGIPDSGVIVDASIPVDAADAGAVDAGIHDTGWVDTGPVPDGGASADVAGDDAAPGDSGQIKDAAADALVSDDAADPATVHDNGASGAEDGGSGGRRIENEDGESGGCSCAVVVL